MSMASSLYRILAIPLLIVFSTNFVFAQYKKSAENLSYSKFYGIGDLHLDYAKGNQKGADFQKTIDSSSYYEYELIRFLILNRDVKVILIELPLYFQPQVDAFLKKGTLETFEFIFSQDRLHILAKFNYLYKLKQEFPSISILCSDIGSYNSVQHYYNSLFCEIMGQIIGDKNVPLSMDLTVTQKIEFITAYESKIDSFCELNNGVVLHELLFELLELRFWNSLGQNKTTRDLNHNLIQYLENDTLSNKLFSDKDKIIQMIKCFIIGGYLKDRKRDKIRDFHIEQYARKQQEKSNSSVVLLYGLAHIRFIDSKIPNVTQLLELGGNEPIVVQIYYPKYAKFYNKQFNELYLESLNKSEKLVKVSENEWGLFFTNFYDNSEK